MNEKKKQRKKRGEEEKERGHGIDILASSFFSLLSRGSRENGVRVEAPDADLGRSSHQKLLLAGRRHVRNRRHAAFLGRPAMLQARAVRATRGPHQYVAVFACRVSGGRGVGEEFIDINKLVKESCGQQTAIAAMGAMPQRSHARHVLLPSATQRSV